MHRRLRLWRGRLTCFFNSNVLICSKILCIDWPMAPLYRRLPNSCCIRGSYIPDFIRFSLMMGGMICGRKISLCGRRPLANYGSVCWMPMVTWSIWVTRIGRSRWNSRKSWGRGRTWPSIGLCRRLLQGGREGSQRQGLGNGRVLVPGGADNEGPVALEADGFFGEVEGDGHVGLAGGGVGQKGGEGWIGKQRV